MIDDIQWPPGTHLLGYYTFDNGATVTYRVRDSNLEFRREGGAWRFSMPPTADGERQSRDAWIRQRAKELGFLGPPPPPPSDADVDMACQIATMKHALLEIRDQLADGMLDEARQTLADCLEDLKDEGLGEVKAVKEENGLPF